MPSHDINSQVIKNRSLFSHKPHSILRRLLQESSTITSFITADFPNQDFVVVLEHNIGGQYYLEVAKYSAQDTTILPPFFIMNNDQKSTITDVDATTSSSLLSSDSPMSPAITSFNDGGFVIACFQGQYQNIVAKKIDATGYSKNIYIDNSELGVSTPMQVSEDAQWKLLANIPRTLSLMSYPDNRFIISFATEVSSVTCDVHDGLIGGPVASCTNPRKTDDCHKVTTTIIAYNSDGSPLSRLFEAYIDDISERGINTLLASTNLLLNDDPSMPNTFFLSYYLTSTQHLLAKKYQLNSGTFTSTNDYVPFINQPIIGERAVAKFVLNKNLKIPGLASSALAVYESRNPQFNNWQIRFDILDPRASPMLIGIDNQAGLYHDMNPTIIAVENGNTLITFHRYKVIDDSSVGVFMQMLTPTLQFSSPNPQTVLPWALDTVHCQDVYSSGNYNAVDILARNNSTMGAVYYCLNGTGNVYPSLPVEYNLMERSPIGIDGGNGIAKIQYAVFSLLSAFFLLLGMAALLHIFRREKLHNKNSEEAAGLLVTEPKLELKYYGSGENSINRFTSFQPQDDDTDKRLVPSTNANRV